MEKSSQVPPICPSCGEVLEPQMQFCVYCGHKMEKISPDPLQWPTQIHFGTCNRCGQRGTVGDVPTSHEPLCFKCWQLFQANPSPLNPTVQCDRCKTWIWRSQAITGNGTNYCHRCYQIITDCQLAMDPAVIGAEKLANAATLKAKPSIVSTPNESHHLPTMCKDCGHYTAITGASGYCKKKTHPVMGDTKPCPELIARKSSLTLPTHPDNSRSASNVNSVSKELPTDNRALSTGNAPLPCKQCRRFIAGQKENPIGTCPRYPAGIYINVSGDIYGNCDQFQEIAIPPIPTFSPDPKGHCATCKYFAAKSGTTGNCKAYDRSVWWQATCHTYCACENAPKQQCPSCCAFNADKQYCKHLHYQFDAQTPPYGCSDYAKVNAPQPIHCTRGYWFVAIMALLALCVLNSTWISTQSIFITMMIEILFIILIIGLIASLDSDAKKEIQRDKQQGEKKLVGYQL